MNRRGGVLIVVLVVLTATISTLAVVLASSNTEFRASLYRSERVQTRLLAESAARYVVANFVDLTSAPVTQLDSWYELGSQGNERFMVGTGSFRFQVIDAASLVNLNTATEEQLENLGLTTEQVESLEDWREDGQNPRLEGAKDEYYTQLDQPYLTKLRRMDTLDELLLVRGFDGQTIYQAPQQTTTSGNLGRALAIAATVDSFSPTTSPAGQPLINLNSATTQSLQQAGIPQDLATTIILSRAGGGFTSMGQVLRIPAMTTQAATILANQFVVGGEPRKEGLININTASEETLETFSVITPDIAQNIVSRQSTGFQSLGELFQIPGYTVQVAADTIDHFTTNSETFIVRILAEKGSVRLAMEAVVSLNNNRPRILKMTESPLEDPLTSWAWQDEATTETVVGVEP
ncbi:MAG: general secretion pathway protein GspK [Armatimonadetes bacterium]|nr:general secretion pathway protein GspK [Armatimonadota bacterium]